MNGGIRQGSLKINSQSKLKLISRWLLTLLEEIATRELRCDCRLRSCSNIWARESGVIQLLRLLKDLRRLPLSAPFSQRRRSRALLSKDGGMCTSLNTGRGGFEPGWDGEVHWSSKTSACYCWVKGWDFLRILLGILPIPALRALLTAPGDQHKTHRMGSLKRAIGDTWPNTACWVQVDAFRCTFPFQRPCQENSAIY